jgi:spore germination protein YaaH
VTAALEPTTGAPVNPGDTACRFAGRFGVEPVAMLVLNRLDIPVDAPLPTDRRLALPVNAPARYRVRPGDTLISISRYLGVTPESLAQKNGLENANQLQAGAQLTIPAGAWTACDNRPTATTTPPQRSTMQAALERSPSSEVISPPIEVIRSQEALDHARTATQAAEERYQSADFAEALALVGVARHILEPLPASEEQGLLAARASWVSGQALVGLGRNTEAIEEFRLALQLDPSLAATTELSPKIAALVETAQAKLP